MATWKSIVTLTWELECGEEECRQLAKSQLAKILQTPHDFEIKIDVIPVKSKSRLVHLGNFSMDDVFPYITLEHSKRTYVVGEKSYEVKMNSDRYHVFKANQSCVACGITGTQMLLEIGHGSMPHFNFYAIENDCLVLMTKDHVIAKSKGGKDELSNFQTCCSICNNLKSDCDLSYDQVRELRLLYNNRNKLSRKELRRMINTRKEQMSRTNAL